MITHHKHIGSILPSRLPVAFALIVLSVFSTTTIGNTSPLSAKRYVDIGFLAETSGQFQNFGTVSAAAAQIAISNINRSGGAVVRGKHYYFRLVLKNDNSDPAQATTSARALILENHVHFIFGGIGTIAPVVFPISDKYRVLYFEPSSGASPFIEKGQSHYMIGTQPGDAIRQGASAYGIRKFFAPHDKRIAILGYNDSVSAANLPAFRAAARRAKMTIVDTELESTTTTDLSSALLRIENFHPDVLYQFATAPGSQQTLIQENNSLNAVTRVFAYSADCVTAAAAGPRFVYAAQPTGGVSLSPPSSAAAAHLSNQLTKTMGNKSQYQFAALWQYDFYGVLRAAMERAGSVTNTNKIRRALSRVKYRGVNGPIRVYKDEAVYGLGDCALRGGKVVTIHVTPSEIKHG